MLNLGRFVLILGLASTAVAADEVRTVIVPADTTPFDVQQTDVVRLVEKGIAGAKIEAQVEGPAKIVATNSLRNLNKGRPLIGGQTREFDLKPTGPGAVTVTITMKPPQPNAEARITKYTFTVK
jgi:hypothetical protein